MPGKFVEIFGLIVICAVILAAAVLISGDSRASAATTYPSGVVAPAQSE